MNKKEYFYYWLQGWLELEDPKKISKKQIEMIKEHINLVQDKDYFIGWLDSLLTYKTKIDTKTIELIKEKSNNNFLNLTRTSIIERIGRFDDGRPPALIC